MNIQSRLGILILVTLLPIAIFGAAGAHYLVQKERQAIERGGRDRVRALVTAIDAQLNTSIAPLEVLARSPNLDGEDLAAFRAEAQRALEARGGDWVNIFVSDPQSAEMLMNLLVPLGAPFPRPLDAATIQESARTGQPSVSPVVMGAVLNRPVFAVRAPVLREGKTKYVLSAVVEMSTIGKLIDRQGFPDTWAVAVLDGNYRFVVRRPSPGSGNEFASESLKRALEGAQTGWSLGQLQDSTEIYRAFQRSSISRWSASIAVPSGEIERSLRGILLLIAGFVGAAVVGLWIAWRLAAGISRPIAALAAAAPALGRGEALTLPPAGPMREVQELSRALGEAAAVIHNREERQHVAEQALRSADRAKDEFLAMLGHELRNPLASVSNAAQLLKIAPRTPAVLDTATDILTRQVEHMTRLVDDLLEVGRVTGGKIRLDPQPLDLSALVSEVIATWKSGGRFAHHEMRVDLHAAWISGDRARVHQIVSNLLDNALKYTPAHGEIKITVRSEDKAAVLEVSDTGDGMPPELIARVFDLFVQGERSLARESGGLGMGLTMAKRLVELHGGTIRAESSGLGKGATFTVTFPAIEPQVVSSAAPAPSAPHSAWRILIVEDNRDARESLGALLRVNGHEVLVAESGAQGIDIATAHVPEVVLVDIGLPGIDGYEVARRLRNSSATRNLRLIALTGYASQEDRRRALAAGFDEHLAKPVELEVLEALLRSLAVPIERARQ